MKFDVAPEELDGWATTMSSDPALLRQLASLAKQFGTETRGGATGAADLAGVASELATRFDTVLTTLADLLESLRSRLVHGSGAYAAAEASVRGGVRVAGG